MNATRNPSPSTSRIDQPWVDTAILSAFAVLIRLPGLLDHVVVDWDESMYVLVAREILQGKLPYVAIFQEKPLGAPLLSAMVLAVFGQGVLGLRLLALGAVVATCLLLRHIILVAGLGRAGGLLAGLFFAASSVRLGGMTMNIELLVAPCNALAVALALRHADCAEPGRQRRVIAVIGSVMGLSIWLKYLPAILACILFAALVGHWLHARQARLRGVPALAAIYFLTCWLPSLLSALYYVLMGEWEAFWYCNFGFMPLYVGISRPGLEILVTFAIFGLQAGILIFLTLAAWLLWRDAPRVIIVGTVWLVAEAMAVAAPGRFYDHYFIGMLPPLSLLAGVGSLLAARRLLPANRLARLARLPVPAIGLFPLLIAALLLASGQAGLGAPNATREIARLIRADTDPLARVWTINSDPLIYVLLGQELPSKFAMPPHVVSAQSVLMRADPMLEVNRILATRPRFLIYDPKRGPMMLDNIRTHIADVVARDYALHAEVQAHEFAIQLYRRRD